MNKYPQHTVYIFFFLYWNLGRGSECTVAPGVAENLSEDDFKQVGLSPQKMANKKLVRLMGYSCESHCFIDSDIAILMVHLVLYYKSKTKLFLIDVLSLGQVFLILVILFLDP